MATKRLQRTVIEGGRTHWSCFQRRTSHRPVRRAEREQAIALRADPGDERPHPRRRKVGRSFFDKLGPVARWLAKQTGRPWRLVYGEIMRRFDTRTLAGRHVVFDHLLPRGSDELREGWSVHRWRHVFHVDAHGILRCSERSWSPRRRPLSPIREQTEAWLRGRRVGMRGGRAYWMTRTSTGELEVRFRQGVALDATERDRVDAFTDAERERFVIELEPGALPPRRSR